MVLTLQKKGIASFPLGLQINPLDESNIAITLKIVIFFSSFHLSMYHNIKIHIIVKVESFNFVYINEGVKSW